MWNYQIATMVVGIVCAVLLGWIFSLKKTVARLSSENAQLRDQLEEAIKRLVALDKEPTSKLFGTLVDVLVSAGIPGLIFLGAVAASPFYGAAAITATLASFGGLFGMLGGVSFLIISTAVLSQRSIRDVVRPVVTRLLQTKSKPQIVREIDSMPRVVPERFREKAKALLEAA